MNPMLKTTALSARRVVHRARFEALRSPGSARSSPCVAAASRSRPAAR